VNVDEDAQKAADMVRGKNRLTVRGVELACNYLAPIVRAATNDPRALAAVAALETACALRKKRRKRS
jgi:hypothetical protein